MWRTLGPKWKSKWERLAAVKSYKFQIQIADETETDDIYQTLGLFKIKIVDKKDNMSTSAIFHIGIADKTMKHPD